MTKSRVPRATNIPAAPWTLGASRLKQFRRQFAEVVSSREARAAVARTAGSISDMDFRNYVAADARDRGDSLLRAIPETLSDDSSAGARANRNACCNSGRGLAITAAREICIRPRKKLLRRHEGEFPRTMEAALSLPGIGAYTSAAILSIAYGFPAAVLDGNVARVLARLGAVHGDLREPKRWSELMRRGKYFAWTRRIPAIGTNR